MSSSTKFSEFDTYLYSDLNNALRKNDTFVVGVDEISSKNIKFNFQEILVGASNLGTGKKVFKNKTNNKDLNFRSLKGTLKLTIVENAEDLTFDVDETEIDINNLDGVLGLNKGGIGKSLSSPVNRSVLYFDTDASFLELGNSFDIVSGLLETSIKSPLTTKGDLYIYDTSNSRLPVGTNGQYLTPDSSEPKGLKWATLPSSDNNKVAVDSGATANYIGNSSSTGAIRTTAKINKIDGGNYVTLDVDESQIDLSNCNNTTSLFERQYDSGWVDFPDYILTSQGMYPYTNKDAPQFRIINRVVYFKGNYHIGLITPGGSFITDYHTARQTTENNVETSQTGISVSTGQLTLPPFLNLTMDSFDNDDYRLRIVRETFASSDGTTVDNGKGIRYQGACRLGMLNSGAIKVSDLKGALEDPSYAASFSPDHHNIRRIIHIHDTNEQIFDYSAYKNSYDSSGSSANNSVTNLSSYHITPFDGSDAITWGGANINLNGFQALISNTVSIETIVNAVALIS